MAQKSDTRGEIALEWWRKYCAPDTGDAATRARLKRCGTSSDALSVTAAVQLARRLGALQDPLDPRRLETALGLARVLAHVKEHDQERRPMRAAGWPAFPGDRSESEVEPTARPRLSEVRFRRLLLTGQGEEQVAAFTRLVRLLDGRVNITALALDYLTWYRDRTRQRWAFDYYAAAVAAPSSVSSLPESVA